MWGLIKSSISKECTPPCYRIKESRNSVFHSDLNWICLFFIKVWKMDASHLIYLRCCSPFYSSRCIPLGRHRVLFFFFQKIIYQLEGKRDERQEISFAFIAAKWTFTAELLWVFFFFFPQNCYFSVMTILQGEVPPPVTSQPTLLEGTHLISLFLNLNSLENTKFSEIDI